MLKLIKKPSPYKSPIKLFPLTLICIIVLLIIFSINSNSKAKVAQTYAKTLEDTYKLKNKELNSKVFDVDNKLAQLNDKYYEENLSKLFSKEKLAAMAKDAWSYSLKVNDEEFKGDNISTASRSITVVLSQTKDSTKPLPSKILTLGSITAQDKSDTFFEHMIIQTTAPYEKAVKTNGNTTNAIYTFKNIAPGSIITLNLSDPLKERLKLKDNLLEVISK